MLHFLLLLPLTAALQCYNGFEAKINGVKEFEMKNIEECPETSRFCVSGLNNMEKNMVLVGFTELRVWGCEGERAKYTASIMPVCQEIGWSTVYGDLRHCCEGPLCNEFEGMDPQGLLETIDSLNLQQDFSKYVL